MAKQLSYPNPADPANPCAQAYARITSIFIDVRKGFAQFFFSVYANEAASTADKVKPGSVQQVGEHTLIVSGNDFIAGLAAEESKEKNLRQLGYEAAADLAVFEEAIDV